MPLEMASMLEGMDAQLQSSQVSSTVLDSPVSMYQGWNYQNDQQWSRQGWLDQRKNNWMNPWTEYGPFGALDRDVKVDPDSTSLDDTRPKSTVSQEDYKLGSRSVQNFSSESPRGTYSHSPRNSILSPRGSLPNTPSETVYTTPPRVCPSTPQDQGIISPRSSGYSSAPSDFNISSPSPRNYQNSLESRQNSLSPRAAYQNASFNLESPQRNAPSRNIQYMSTPIGSETFRKNQSPTMNHLRSPSLNSSDSYSSNLSSPRYLSEQSPRFAGNATPHNSDLDRPDTKSSLVPKLQAPYLSHQGVQSPRVAGYTSQSNAVPSPISADYLLQNPLHVQSLSNQSYESQHENMANIAEAKRNVNISRGAFNINYPPVSSEQSNWCSLSSWGAEPTKKPVQSPTQTAQQGIASKIDCGNASKPSSWDERLLHSDVTKSPWEAPSEPPSPFRVPKGRPPSRTTPNHNLVSDPGNSHNPISKTFLKPQEPNRNSLFTDSQGGKGCPMGQNHQPKAEWPQDKLREGKVF
jgi:hypothetical protein